MRLFRAIDRYCALLFALALVLTVFLLKDVEASIAEQQLDMGQMGYTLDDRALRVAELDRRIKLMALSLADEEQAISIEAMPAGRKVRVLALRLNQRSCASLDCAVKAQVDQGQELDVIDTVGDWHRVRTSSSKEGLWISRHYVENIAPEKPAAPSQSFQIASL